MTRLRQLAPDSGEYGFQCPECGGWLRRSSKSNWRHDDVPEEEFLKDSASETSGMELVCTKCSSRLEWRFGHYPVPPYVRLAVEPEFDGDPPPKLEVVCEEKADEQHPNKEEESDDIVGQP